MTLCNVSAYLNYKSGIFNVYIDIKTEFKMVVYFNKYLTPGKKFVRMGQSLRAGAQMYTNIL